MIRSILQYVLMVSIVIGGVGCLQQAPMQKSPLTPGMAKKYIYRGETTEAEVLEIFGPPDLVVHKEGRERWTYDKISHDVTSSSGFLTVLLFSYGKESSRRSSRSIMLIIDFDRHEVVQEYRLHSTQF
ncbi:MAG: hypothetical protein HYV02_08335 [Deltaproteobacteria bacterium]|nr:hypothetical protein [Deltaproteobacteria bacterium]